MKLTKKKAIEISIELWTFLAETGKEKSDWEGWEEYREMDYLCPLCEYATSKGMRNCRSCPYWEKFRWCYSWRKPFWHWEDVSMTKTKKKYAKLFLEQLKQL